MDRRGSGSGSGLVGLDWAWACKLVFSPFGEEDRACRGRAGMLVRVLCCSFTFVLLIPLLSLFLLVSVFVWFT